VGGVGPTGSPIRTAGAPGSTATPPRADLESIWPYVPGRHRSEIARQYGVTDILKLASNENPRGPSPRALAALRESLGEAHYYPDSQARELREAIAERLGLTIEHVVLGSGSVECIDLVARAFLRPGDRAIVGFPSFARFTIACQVVGAEVVTVPHRNWTFDLDGVADAIDDRTRVVFLDNPCNPTGTHVPDAEITAFLDRIPERVLVVLDRAYYEFVPPDQRSTDDLTRIRAGANLVALRTFSKAYGLAGLRIGYAVTRPEHARVLNRVREAFNTSSVAQAAALAAIDDQAHVAETVATIAVEREWLSRAYDRLGVVWVPSTTNFLFVDLGERSSEINEGLLRRGIIIRPMTHPSIAGWARISVWNRSGNQRLIAALEDLIG
jgi:histidinol-phosphate aminotransferase